MPNGTPTNQQLGALSEQHTRDIITVREYFDTIIGDLKSRMNERFEQSDKSVSAALAAADRAVNKAEIATEKRFEGVNEFRSQLADQASTLMPRAETEIRLKALNDKIDTIDVSVLRNQGRISGTNQIIGYVIGGVGVLVALLVGILYIVKK